jgi:hypothetical protein
VRSVIRSFLVVPAIAASLYAQSADIPGWSDLHWGATKAEAMKSLRRFHPHDCSRPDPSCGVVEPTVVLETYDFAGVRFNVALHFGSKNALSKVTMTTAEKREAVEKVLTQLTARHGRPGLESEYDGDEETLHTTWTWVKPHGICKLDSEEGSGVFVVTYETRR